jgi:hypothetical protein
MWKGLNDFTDLAYQMEHIIPFATYVYNDQSSSQPHVSLSLSNFLNLPYELRLLIYEECSIPALYVLMRASRAFRYEVQPLFWALSSVWYQTEHEWLINEHGYPSSEAHCSVFARQVQQVEINFDAGIRIAIEGRLDQGYESMEGLIEEFWISIRRNFPAAKSVVLTQIPCSRLATPPSEESLMLARGSPSDLEVFYTTKFADPEISDSSESGMNSSRLDLPLEGGCKSIVFMGACY